jgi:hypothetical protein
MRGAFAVLWLIRHLCWTVRSVCSTAAKVAAFAGMANAALLRQVRAARRGAAST